MITGWRHADMQKSDKDFRLDVQKEFERIYLLGSGKDPTFMKAVKEAIDQLIIKGAWNKGRDGFNGLNGTGGLNGIGLDGSGTRGDDGDDGDDGEDGECEDCEGGGGDEDELLGILHPQGAGAVGFVSKLDIGWYDAARTSASGLIMVDENSYNNGGEDYYNTNKKKFIAHAPTSNWMRVGTFPAPGGGTMGMTIAEARFHPSTWGWAAGLWSHKGISKNTPEYDAIKEALGDKDWLDDDNNVTFPLMLSDIYIDGFGHVQKIRLSNAADLVNSVVEGKDLKAWNKGLSWKVDGIEKEFDDPDGFYNINNPNWIGHGHTSNWTVGKEYEECGGDPCVEYDPFTGRLFAEHRFGRGNWMTYQTNDQDVDDGTAHKYPAFPSVVTGFNADQFGHVTWLATQQMMNLLAGDVLEYQTLPWMSGMVPGQIVTTAIANNVYQVLQDIWVHEPKRVGMFVNSPGQSYSEFQDSLTFYPAGSVFKCQLNQNVAYGVLAWVNSYTPAWQMKIRHKTIAAPVQDEDSDQGGLTVEQITWRVPKKFTFDGFGHVTDIVWKNLTPPTNGVTPNLQAHVVAVYELAGNQSPYATVFRRGGTPDAFPIFDFTFWIPIKQGGKGDVGPPPNVTASYEQVAIGTPAQVTITSGDGTVGSPYNLHFKIPVGGTTNVTMDAIEALVSNGDFGVSTSAFGVPRSGVGKLQFGRKGSVRIYEGSMGANSTEQVVYGVPSSTIIAKFNPGINPVGGWWQTTNQEYVALDPDGVTGTKRHFGGIVFHQGTNVSLDHAVENTLITNSLGEFSYKSIVHVKINASGGGGGGGGGNSFKWNMRTTTGAGSAIDTRQMLEWDLQTVTLKPLNTDAAVILNQTSDVSGATITMDVETNTATKKGVVTPGSTTPVAALLKSVWGADTSHNPNWRPVVKLMGSKITGGFSVNLVETNGSFNDPVAQPGSGIWSIIIGD